LAHSDPAIAAAPDLGGVGLAMSIRHLFGMIALTVIGLFSAIFYLMTLEVRNQRDLEAAGARRHASYKLAGELRRSSDDLTRMARTYVVTGDSIYETHFRKILAIRNGTAPRPVDYGPLYWDVVIDTGEAPGPAGEPVALQTLMRQMDFTEEEFAKLRESESQSNALVELEDRAMGAVKGLFADSKGGYTAPGEPDMALAQELLHGAAYHRAKNSIMTPIEEFTEMVEGRTAREITALQVRSEFLMRAALGLIALAVGLLVIGLILLQRRVARPVGKLVRVAQQAESGDYRGRVEVRSGDEIGQLARAFNQMSSAIESDIEARERSAAEIAQAHRAADAANQAKSTFLANMSHELRTPMNAILGYSEMLMEDASDDGNEEAVSDLGKIHAAGQHLLSLINDVLDLSKIEAGKMDLFLENFDIEELVNGVTTTVDSLVKTNGNRLDVELDPALGEMRADATKLRQVLFNLLSNAAKFTKDGEIGLRAGPVFESGQQWVEISVSDSGIGIPADKLEHVFAEFSQADERTTRDYGGTGLGLAISSRFCEMMGGDITVESTLGEGSRFTVRLPREGVSEEAAASDAPAAVTPDPGRERCVLVIDDDPNALDLLSRALQGADLRVVTASDGAAGLRLARSLLPLAITLDVMMPGMDGWEVLRELKSDPATRDIPVLMVTMTDDKQLGYAFGANEFLTKPVQRSELIQLLSRYTQGDSERHALVVDDQSDNRQILRRALEDEGWQVSEAENGRLALDRVDERAPSLILLDLMMPVMDGFEFVLEMRKRADAPPIPIVVVTAKDITDEDRQRLNGGVVALIERRGREFDSLLTQIRELAAGAAS
jgi:signal transduction histidine kinase/DNA-binding response OmpR family regulator